MICETSILIYAPLYHVIVFTFFSRVGNMKNVLRILFKKYVNAESLLTNVSVPKAI